MDQLIALFTAFFQIGICSIGGGYAIIPAIQEQVVDHYGWVTQKAFTDIITISQMTPGPLAVNTSTFVGMQLEGLPGAITATFGCVISGICIAVALDIFFHRHENSTYVLEVLRGLKAASLGLIVSAAAAILVLTFFGNTGTAMPGGIDWRAVVLFVISLVILRKWKANPILLMTAMGVIGVFVF